VPIGGTDAAAEMSTAGAGGAGRYLTECVEVGIAVTSLIVTPCAINHVHRTHGSRRGVRPDR
jgi:hypothetical protein